MKTPKIFAKLFTSFTIASLIAIGVSPVQAAENRIIDVVAITWPGAPASTVSVEDIRKTINDDVSKRWSALAENWPGGITFKVGSVVSDPIRMNTQVICDGKASAEYMRDARRAFYTKYPVADYFTHYLIILTPSPRPNCVWEGKALMGEATFPGGLVMLKDNASSFVITHELGHTLGLGHTNLIRCPSGSADGDWSGCKAVEYAGAIDIMSNVDIRGPLSTYHQWRMGILGNQDVLQVWKSQKVDLKFTNAKSGIRAIFMRDGNSTYWIEFRKVNDGYSPGLAIYRTDPPPNSSVISPNLTDAEEPPTQAVTSDVWLMNLDTFKYSNNINLSGSPILQLNRTFLNSSGNISLVASLKDEDTVSLSITRKIDSTPPPIPKLSDLTTWNSPDSDLLVNGYEDGESAIDKFQLEIAGKVVESTGSPSDKWFPTYLSPFTPIKSPRVRDLPEGTYSLRIRAIDLYGNVSGWSVPTQVVVDSGSPIVKGEFKVTAINNTFAKLAWVGASDPGSGICSVQVSNSDGFIVSRTDRVKEIFTAPELNFKSNLAGKAQVFDCRGNGVEGELNFSFDFVPATFAKTTGKTKSIGTDVVCTGNCNLSFTASGDLEVRVSKGSGTAFISGTKVGSFRAGSETLKLSVGNTKKVVRISGKDLTIQGLAKVSVQWKETGKVQRKVAVIDPTLADKQQLQLSQFGFQITDFEQDFELLPISRGTTLLDATLDICAGDFPSEKSRVLRRQVAAIKNGSLYSFLSTESVKYKDAKSAESALTDLDAVIAKCKVTGGAVAAQGVITKYQFLEAPKFIFADGVKGRVVLTQIGEGVSARWLLGYFQIKGDLAVNTYLVRAEKFSDADIKRWSAVASEISTRLSGYSPLNLSA